MSLVDLGVAWVLGQLEAAIDFDRLFDELWGNDPNLVHPDRGA